MVTVTKRTTENTDSTTVNLNKLNIEEKKVNQNIQKRIFFSISI